MPIASSPSTSQRLLALLSLLSARRDWPARVLADRLEVTERTIRRDIDRLRELDYAIEATRGPDGGYRLGAGARLPPLVLDDEQAVAVAIALRSAGALGAGIEEAAGQALSTISRTMPTHLARRIENLVLAAATAGERRGPDADPATLLRIGQAIRDGEELRFDYLSPDRDIHADAADEPAPARRAEPHQLLLHSRHWYLIGFSVERDDWRVFRVDRIALRPHNGRRFTPRQIPGGDPALFLAARFKGSSAADAWACRGEVIMHAPIGAVAPYVADGSAEPLGDEHCRVRLGAWSWTSLAASFGRFDADLEVIGPPELAAAFSDLARRFAAAGAPETAAGSDGPVAGRSVPASPGSSRR
ncbi:MAG TPA: WYL domain-containing protein [Cellulomonas sp.]